MDGFSLRTISKGNITVIIEDDVNWTPSISFETQTVYVNTMMDITCISFQGEVNKYDNK